MFEVSVKGIQFPLVGVAFDAVPFSANEMNDVFDITKACD